MKKFILIFTFLSIAQIASTQLTISDVRINEIDADTPGTDMLEFIELFGTPNLDISGLVLVQFDGNDDASRVTYDLTGQTLDANGYFVIGNAGVSPAPDLIVSNNTFQNGPEAFALYNGSVSDFPDNTPATTTNLIDAIVYDTDDPDDAGLLTGLGQSIQYNEDENNNKDTESIQRLGSGWVVRTPTPKSTNILPVNLTRFDGKYDNFVSLDWTTSSEINNDYFIVERSNNVRDFEAIGKVEGSGSTSEERDYSFIDRAPLPGTNYYRLAQYDFNGEMEYHKTIAVSTRNNQSNVFPTTVYSYLNIDLQKPSEILLYDLSGKKVLSFSADQPKQIDVSHLPNGSYLVNVISSGVVAHHRFTKI